MKPDYLSSLWRNCNSVVADVAEGCRQYTESTNSFFEFYENSKTIPELDKYIDIPALLKNFDVCNYSFQNNIENAVSPVRLDYLQKKRGDVIYPLDMPNNDNRYIAEYYDGDYLETYITNTFGFVARNSGYFWYPYRGYSGWHTNSDRAGDRVYLVWAQEDNKSFFRYQDPVTKEIVTHWEKAGWQVNHFRVPKKGKLWHCIGSYTNRVSIGFRALQPEDLESDEDEEGLPPLHGIHTCFVGEKWNVLPNIDSFIDLTELGRFLVDKTPVVVPHADIGWKAKHDPRAALDSRYQKCDYSCPGILAEGVANPYDLKYRMVDGKHRLAKMSMETDIKASPYYILSRDEFFAAMILGRPA